MVALLIPIVLALVGYAYYRPDQAESALTIMTEIIEAFTP